MRTSLVHVIFFAPRLISLQIIHNINKLLVKQTCLDFHISQIHRNRFRCLEMRFLVVIVQKAPRFNHVVGLINPACAFASIVIVSFIFKVFNQYSGQISIRTVTYELLQVFVISMFTFTFHVFCLIQIPSSCG